MSMTQTTAWTFYYFEACGFVSQPFEAADLAAAEAHVLATFRLPGGPDFDGDDGGIVGQADGWWECLTTFIGDTDHNPSNVERLAAAADGFFGPDAPTPGAP